MRMHHCVSLERAVAACVSIRGKIKVRQQGSVSTLHQDGGSSVSFVIYSALLCTDGAHEACVRWRLRASFGLCSAQGKGKQNVPFFRTLDGLPRQRKEEYPVYWQRGDDYSAGFVDRRKRALLPTHERPWKVVVLPGKGVLDSKENGERRGLMPNESLLERAFLRGAAAGMLEQQGWKLHHVSNCFIPCMIDLHGSNVAMHIYWILQLALFVCAKLVEARTVGCVKYHTFSSMLKAPPASCTCLDKKGMRRPTCPQKYRCASSLSA